MTDYLKYSKSIGKSLSNLVNTIKDDANSLDILQSMQQYIGCKGFVYEKSSHKIIVRSILLKLWSKLLLILKTAYYLNQNTIFTFVTYIINRDEFLLENCSKDGSIEQDTRSQLIQYIFLLKLSLLYTPRAIVSTASPAREFVFTTISASIIRIPEYRVCFFTQLQGLIRATAGSIDAGIEFTSFNPSIQNFTTKYIDPHLLMGDSYEESLHSTSPYLLPDVIHPPLLEQNQSFASHTESEFDLMSLPSERIEDHSLDMQSMVANLPPAYTIKNDLIIFHEDSENSYYKKEEDFCYDDHNFDIVSIEDDHCENPYSTKNIQDILRSQHYLNSSRQATVQTDSLPPLKLPNMNVVIDMMYERYTESVEEQLRTQVYVNSHPSLFDWDSICKEQVETSQLTTSSNYKSNDEEESTTGSGLHKEIIGDLYLDTQVIDLFGRSKALLSQFITFYMKYIRSYHQPDEIIVWQSIPGYFLLMRLFLINFQEFFMSKLSSGILRINIKMERIIKDSIAYSLCDNFVVDGEVLNTVMSILFDKCNVNVFLDISKCLMVLHNLLKAIRDYNNVIYYHEYSMDFYRKVYASPEIKLLLQLQELNKTADLPTLQSSVIVPPSPHYSSHTHSPQEATDLDLSTLDAMSHSNHYYNNNLSIIYASTNAFDLLYETTIDSTIKYKSMHHPSASGSYSLHRLPSRWMKQSVEDELDPSLHESIEIEPMEWDEVSASVSPSLASEVTFCESKEECRKSAVIQNNHRFMNGNIEGFTHLQAVQYLLDHDIISTRGEGLDFLSILQDRRIVEPLCYERRFRTTVFHLVKLSEIKLYRYPEISLYNHNYFEDRINYVYFLYVLKGLIKMPHVQIIEKILSFIYFNEDFFNGKHRLQLYKEIIFPNFALFFTHWNANVRHIFHRLLIYKMVRTRWSYLPRYTALDLENELYNRIFEHRKELRKKKTSLLHEDIVEEENENNLYSYSKETQQKIWNHFDFNAYMRSQSSRLVRQNTQRIITCLQLQPYREVQDVDLKLAGMLKANLHILLNVNQEPNHNQTNGKRFIPANQIRYFWTSFLEYVTLLSEYERAELHTKAKPIYTSNLYQDGVGNVEDTDIPWVVVNEMESRVMDPNNDIEFFLAHKN